MSTLNVELENLKSGVRYSFTENNNPSIIEGTFDRVVPPSEDIEDAQYLFTNVVEYRPDPKPNNPNNISITKSRRTTFANPNRYPQNIHVSVFNELPGDLNQMINAYGGKSRKNRKNKKSNRRNRKSRKSRKNRKSKKI